MRPRKKIRKPIVIEKELKRGKGFYLRYWIGHGKEQVKREPLIIDEHGQPATEENVDFLVARALETIAAGKHPFRTLVPFAEFIPDYLKSLDNDPSTKEGKEGTLEYFFRRLKEERGLRYVAEIGIDDLDWYEGERKPNLAKSTWRRELSYIRHAMRYAVKEGLLEKDPTINCTAPKPKYSSTWLKEPVTQEEHQKLVAALPFASACAWRFCMETGCRPSEMWGVTIDSFHAGFQQAAYVMNKTKKHRPVVLSEGLAEDLAKLAKGRPRSELLFLSPAKLPWNKNSWIKHLYWYLDKAGIERRINPNLARHTVATTLAEDFSTRELMEFMGWENAETPMKYTHATKKRLAAMAEQLHVRARPEKAPPKDQEKSGG